MKDSRFKYRYGSKKMKELSIEEIKKIEIDLLREIKKICEENNYEYYLFFGTLIGCIRHSGFIPWDDDIDIVMPRDDYEKFIHYCIDNKESLYPYGIVHYYIKKRYSIVIAKFENKKYMLYGKNGECCEIGINIDIYPLDGVGNKQKDVKKATSNVIKWKKIGKYFKKHTFKTSNNIWVNRVKYRLFLIYEKLFDVWVSSLDKKVRKKKISNCKYIGIPCWQPDVGSYFDKSLLEKTEGTFEGDIYPIPKGYDVVLRQIYGDYMKLPSKEDRMPRHIDKAYEL